MRVYHKGSFLFTLLIFMFISLLFFVTLGYDETSRLLPLIVLTPALIITLLCLIGGFLPALLARTTVDLNRVGIQRIEAETSVDRAHRLAGTKGLLIVGGWLIGFIVLIVLAGYLIAIPIALFVFFKVLGGEGWLRSLVITIAVEAFVYGIFDFLLKVGLFRGILFGEIIVT